MSKSRCTHLRIVRSSDLDLDQLSHWDQDLSVAVLRHLELL